MADIVAISIRREYGWSGDKLRSSSPRVLGGSLNSYAHNIVAKEGRSIEFRRFKDYWKKGLPYIDEIKIQPVTDALVRFVALRTGDVDVADRIPNEQVLRIQKGEIKDIEMRPIPAAGYRGMIFNMKRLPFSDQRAREAVALTIDKEEILELGFRGLGTITDQKNIRSSVWFIPLPARKKDLSLAKKLLAEAGYANGLSFKALGEKGREDELIVIQSQLKRAGMRMEIEVLDFATYSARQRAGDFDMVSSGGGVESDPHVNLYVEYHSEEGERLNNESGYSNARVDQLLEDGKRTASFQKRYAIYKEVVETVHRELPELPYILTPYVYGIRPHVKGLEFLETSSRYNYAGGGLPVAWIAK